jgi:hypothetical protein
VRGVRSLVALAVVLALAVAYLGYRVVTLEQRLDAVNQQLGAPVPDRRSAGAAGAATIARTTKPTTAVAQGLEPRLSLLEQQLASLRADVRSLEAATESTLNQPPADPKQILSVVGSEVGRIRDAHLQFQRAQWLKWRRGGLAQFTTDYSLSDQQRADLDDLLTDEIDRWLDLLRREDLADKPEQLAAEARAALRDTDEAARHVLDPMQHVRWMQIRAIERMVLWPFLPE